MNTQHIIYPNKFSTDIDQFELIAKNENLSKNDLRVFMFLCCRMGSKHPIKIDKGQMSESLNISKKKIEECLEHLEMYDIIAKADDNHTKNGYVMSYC